MKNDKLAKCVCSAACGLCALGASAAEMYYKGDLAGGVTNAQNYCLTARLQPDERFDRLPGADHRRRCRKRTAQRGRGHLSFR